MSVTMIWLVWLFAFSGFFVPIDSIMPPLRWMVVINPASYGELSLCQSLPVFAYLCASLPVFDVLTLSTLARSSE